MTNRTVPMYPGESRYIDFNFTEELRDGQTVASGAYTIEDDAPVTQVDGTAAVNGAGTIAQARFTLAANATPGEQYTVTCAATCANPTETRISYAIIDVLAIG